MDISVYPRGIHTCALEVILPRDLWIAFDHIIFLTVRRPFSTATQIPLHIIIHIKHLSQFLRLPFIIIISLPYSSRIQFLCLFLSLLQCFRHDDTDTELVILRLRLDRECNALALRAETESGVGIPAVGGEVGEAFAGAVKM